MFKNFWNSVYSALSITFQKNQPHLLPEIELTNNYDHVTLRIIDFEKDFCYQSLFDIQDRLCDKNKEGLVLTSNEILTFRFLKPVSKIRDNFYRSKIVITDKDSHEIIKRAVNTFVQKKNGISCIFEINDYVSNSFSQNLDVVYLINLTDPSDEEYKKLLNDVRQRLAHSCTIFLTYLIDPFDRQEAVRLNELKQVLNERGLDELFVVGAFNAINPRVASLYNRPSLGYLKEIFKKSKKSSNQALNQTISCKLAFRLLNILEQMNQFPIIRYLQTFHDYNSVIASFCLQGLTALKESRNSDFKAYSEDCILLIIDRSFDLLTPILHSLTYQAFVTQELELLYESPIEEIDKLLRNESIFQIAKTLIETSNKFKANNIKLNDKEKNEISQILITHTEIINNLTYKLKSGYTNLIDVEQVILNQNSQSSLNGNKILTTKEKEKIIKKLIKDNYNQMIPFDLIRLLMIYATLNPKVKKRSIKSLLKLNKNMSNNDVNKIFAFLKLIQSINKKSSQNYDEISNGPLIKNIIDQIMNDALDEQKFPFAAEWMKDLPINKRKKIILFVRGGLSYNELYLANSLNDFEVILCSDTILTPRMFFSILLTNQNV